MYTLLNGVGQLYGKHNSFDGFYYYYILTTNQDTQFARVFPEEKISAIQGDWRYFQCSRRCHDELYDSIETLHKLEKAIDSDLKVPADIPERGVI